MSTGVLLPAPVTVAITGQGVPIPGALMQFYLTGTTTPTPVYADAALTTPRSNPVVANGNGQFPAIFLDPTITYRVQLQNASSSVIADIDPLNVDVVAATQAQVNAGVATGVYVSPATLAAWTGVATALGYTPVNKAGDTATNLLINPAAPAVTSAGYLGAPINTQNGAYTLLISDAGKTINSTSAVADTWTVPPNSAVAFPLGTIIAFVNTGTASVTIAPGAGVTQNLAGAGTAGARTLAQWGVATAIQVALNQWLFSGTNLT
ncbi:MAG TPA: hypothetical protein VIJ59_07140 [Caulobacteraceae bacterium]